MACLEISELRSVAKARYLEFWHVLCLLNRFTSDQRSHTARGSAAEADESTRIAFI